MIRSLSGKIALVSLVIPLILLPVSANIMFPTVTQVYFEKDGAPYNGTVMYTMNCYGHYRYPWINAAATTETKDTPPEIVFSYSATCTGYGCAVSEGYYLNYRAIDSCDLEGMAGDTPFVLHNFARTPVPPNCTMLRQFDIARGYGEYFRTTPEYQECRNSSSTAAELCDTYTIPCPTIADFQCGNRVVAGRLVNDTEKARSCRDEAKQQERACDRFLERVDPSSMVMWKNNLSGSEEPAMRACEARFAIPQDTPAPVASPEASLSPRGTTGADEPLPESTFGARAVATSGSFDPVGTLYCSILLSLGGKCE